MVFRELTKAEEQVMLILWDLQEAVVKDILAKMQIPKPAYNTVSTVIRVLESKGFVDHKAVGTTHIYFPIVTEKQYKSFALDQILSTYFDNSYQSLASFLVKEKNVDLTELDELIKLAEQLKQQK